MIDLLTSLVTVPSLITICVFVATFATVMTLAAPYMPNDSLRARMQSIQAEREGLKAQLRASLQQQADARLRKSKSDTSLMSIVRTFNLTAVFDPESSRDKLAQAGYRNESHLYAFFVIRLVAPFALGLLALFYVFFLAPQHSGGMRTIIVTMAMAAGFYLPQIMLTNQINRRQTSIKRAWSDALDLLIICVEAGMAVEPAIQRVASEIGSQSIPLAEELALTNAELSYLQDRRKAFENLARRTGLATVRAVVTSLIQAERYGTPLGQALRVLGQENREARMQEAERKAAALPPKLTVPMMVFFMPVIFVVLLGPIVIQVVTGGMLK